MVGAAIIDGNFIVHWVVTTAVMLGIYFAIRYALKEG
jgi:hypothetical protein